MRKGMTYTAIDHIIVARGWDRIAPADGYHRIKAGTTILVIDVEDSISYFAMCRMLAQDGNLYAGFIRYVEGHIRPNA